MSDPRVAELVKQLEAEGFTPEDLDEAVHNAADERATGICNDGLDAQVEFLLIGGDNSWKPSDVLFAARSAAKEGKDREEEDDDFESSQDHWSSPNGCHEDCPACAEEAEHHRKSGSTST